MIKGVSRKVVEINNPDSAYFEKAIFYLKPHMSDIPPKLLTKEAENYIFSVSQKSKENDKLKTAFPLICMILSIIVLIIGSVYSLFNL